jgi:hypothetical protein
MRKGQVPWDSEWKTDGRSGSDEGWPLVGLG